MAVANMSYLLHDLDGAGALLEGRQLLVVDEADELPGAIVQHLTVEVTPQDLQLLGLAPPEGSEEAAAWRRWAGEAVPKAHEAIAREEEALAASDDSLERAEVRRRIRRLERLAREDDVPWVVASREGSWQLRPLYPAAYASFPLWGRLEGSVLLMSATIAGARLLARELGIPRGAWSFLSAPSPIPPERRPVRYIPVASLSHANAERTWPLVVEAMDSILDAHLHDRGVVHTHSYRLAAHVLAASRHRRRLVGHEGAGDRSHALRRHRQGQGAVLVSPSMERGVDFAGDRARFAVLLKTPYPNLGDPWVAARLASPGGQEWYAREAVRAVVQACGRVCRGPTDFGVTYILDASFGRLLKGYGRLFPQWFLAALRTAQRDGGETMTAAMPSPATGGARPWA
jgi:Rad3-related DNA helicase